MKKYKILILSVCFLLIAYFIVFPRNASSDGAQMPIKTSIDISSVEVIREVTPETIQDYARLKTGSEWESFNYIVSHESSWRYDVKNAKSTAFGLCQTMMSLHEKNLVSDFRTNPRAQIDWCIDYAFHRYGSITEAEKFWRANRWW